MTVPYIARKLTGVELICGQMKELIVQEIENELRANLDHLATAYFDAVNRRSFDTAFAVGLSMGAALVRNAKYSTASCEVTIDGYLIEEIFKRTVDKGLPDDAKWIDSINSRIALCAEIFNDLRQMKEIVDVLRSDNEQN